VLFRFIDLKHLGDLFKQTRWHWWSLGLGIWMVLYLVRAKRFALLAPRTPYATMLCITAMHNFLLRLLPFRTGELAYVFLMKRAGTAGMGESFLGLVLLRILDSTAVVILFGAALAFHQGTYLGDRRLGLLAAGIASLMGIGAVAALIPLLRLALKVTTAFLKLFHLDNHSKLKVAMTKINEAIESFGQVQRNTMLWSVALSFLLWLLTFAAFFAIMRAFSMPVGLAQTILGSTAAVVTGFLPIGGIGSFGTLEAGWALGFHLVGLGQAQAVASGFGVSLSTFTYGALLGGMGYLGLGFLQRKERTEPVTQ
jgi:hypothetical protein